jgi:hypothetical protein
VAVLRLLIRIDHRQQDRLKSGPVSLLRRCQNRPLNMDIGSDRDVYDNHGMHRYQQAS